MPSIDVAMIRSVATRRSFLDVLAAAVGPAVYGRGVADVEGKITDVKTAFSSWDNCMKADFCKWPVIAIIIVGGLIVLSIVWCIARCLCCGLSCCCECCYCLKCCGDCCGCCDPPRGKRNKYLDEPYIPPHQGYRSEAPMATGLPYKAPVADAPQFANFDVSKSAGHEDALPAMPSWETANNKKVYLEEEVEMDNLKKPENTTQTAPLLNTRNVSPGPGTPSPLGSPSPVGPYGARSPTSNTLGSGHPAVSNGYLAAGAIPNVAGAGSDPYGRGGPGYVSPQQSGVLDHYDAELEDNNNNHGGYGAGAMAAGALGAGAMGRQSPHQFNNQRPGYGGASPPPQQRQGGYGRAGQGPNAGNYYDGYRGSANNTPQGYGMERRSPRIPDLGMDNRSPRIPDVGGVDNRSPRIPELSSGNESDFGVTSSPNRYASPAPYGAASSQAPANGRLMNNRPPPQRQYSGATTGNGGSSAYGSQNNVNRINTNTSNNKNNENYGPAEMPASPTLQNSGGFDFISGSSRPQAHGQDSYGSSSANNYNGGYDSSSSRPLNNTSSPPPLQQPQPERTGYPGYRAYRG
ncbi:uncharacterized protein SPSK_03223 [Sporothrix schenckii 1099-18]|uniref:Fibroin-3 related protein n=1 Tax=Sporothrix schenckii 1099-18 TaxID=1397361 RepID=A0A0F2M1F6_SPOSC|nr:uncharacterized protein SPSK_03223 [Sporothrix schenckii 1099-18]KJR82595.1 hypothetical protein SPSK_03223 [Sporothrix schenckii 1099-18]